jgi:ATP-dependent RNA helicase DeaD
MSEIASLDDLSFAELVGAPLAGALEGRGFTELTSVQLAVLAPDLAGRDLRISSQTGSGKTVAIGFTLRDFVAGRAPAHGNIAHPRALVVTPTRELAKQVEQELGWLFAPLRAKVASVTGGGGGGGYRDELRAFREGPAVVVGTPGRLLDHLTRGRIDPSEIAAVVLDEADRMLDLGFRDDIEAIIAHAPQGHRTHLVSATFPREVLALADAVQDDPARVEGTPHGGANADIDHVLHLVRHDERLAAIINLLLATSGSPTLVFVHTRSDVAALAAALGNAGFRIGMLSGEMEQPERTRALAAFREGRLDALVATDVAARGIDVSDVARVIHADPPGDPDAYTHRSGRTGRAGRKGTSSVLVTPASLVKTLRVLARAGIKSRYEPIPKADDLRAAEDERVFEAVSAANEEPRPDQRAWTLAKRIMSEADATRAIAALLMRARTSGPAPRDVTPIEPPRHESWRGGGGTRFETGPAKRVDRGDAGDRGDRGDRNERGRPEARAEETRAPRRAEPGGGAWVSFRVTWGQVHGADPRRLLAMVCRRGNIEGRDVGAIRVERTFSVVDVAASVAPAFDAAATEPDPRDPRVKIERWRESAPQEGRPAQPRHGAKAHKKGRPKHRPRS